MNPDRLKAFATTYAVAWCSQDAASVAAFFEENGSLTINGGTPSVGRRAIAAALVAESQGHFDEAEYQRQTG